MNTQSLNDGFAPRVFLIDDDEPVLVAVALLIKSTGLKCDTFSSAQEYLDSFDPVAPGCVVTDLRMPEISGLDLQERLARMEQSPPVILITGHGDVPAAVRAIQLGALDFIEKPFVDDVLIAAINKAIEQDSKNRHDYIRLSVSREKLATLTDRELEVMTGVVAGKPNKIIADDLNLSIKTVEYHRANVMSKMDVLSVADLVKIVIETRLSIEFG